MGNLPKSPAGPTVVEELDKALGSLDEFYDAALETQRRQERRVVGEAWMSVDDMRVAADRAGVALMAARHLLPEGFAPKVLTWVADALEVWSRALEELAQPRSTLRNPFEVRTVAHALSECSLWTLAVRRALRDAESAQAASEEVSS